MNNLHSLVLVTTLALMGCAAPQKIEPLRDVVLAPEKDTINIPAETLRDCDPIPKLEDRAYKQGEVPAAINAIVTVASDCRKRKADGDASIRKAFNISK